MVSGTFTLTDFSLDMPDSLSAGTANYRVVNDGPQDHEFALLKLQPGTTATDVLGFYRAPQPERPFTPVGGMQALRAGESGSVVLNLQPGSVAAVCLLPDSASGLAHLYPGMVKLFTVR